MDILSYILGKKAGGGGGEAPVLIDKTITENGTYNASDDAADGYKTVEVDVPTTDPSLMNKIASGVYEDGDVVELPITTLGRTFSQTSGKFTLNLPNLVSFRTPYNFEQTTFTSVRFPLCTGSLSSGAAKSCQNLVTWFAPLMTVLQQALASCPNLETAVIGGLEMQWEQFKNDTALAIVDIAKPNNRNVIDNSFSGCTSLETLIIRSQNVARLSNITTFASGKFEDGGTGGTLYVPQALIADYQAATNWSTILGYANNKILPIEGSIYETQYADGTPIS